MGGRLVLQGADGDTSEFELGAETTLGRAADNQIALDDPKVSRVHAVVRSEPDGGFFLIDLGSANGTLFNDRRIVTATRLRNGDTVRVGSTLLWFVDDTPSTDESPDDRGRETTTGPDADETVLLGTSAPMLELFRMIEKAASSRIPVLIEGESGTGKELVASAIHQASDRARAPYLAVNCATFTEGVLESELFGHRRGAFTGASADRLGLFETADSGTVFLDEIGEMPLSIQPKLLRVLQEKEITRVGETRSRRVDVRLISATNRDLLAQVERGAFRADLYYRLSAFPIGVPALRDRREDIRLLAQRFLVTAAKAHGKRVRPIDDEALNALLHFDWPGNVRELQNQIQRAVALARSGDTIGLAHLSPKIVGGQSPNETAAIEPLGVANSAAERVPGSDDSRQVSSSATPCTERPISLQDARAAFETKYIAQIMEREGGNVSAAARVLGMTRVGLHRKLRDLGLR